jgi:predicted ABC-type transport system involved in lysophospholipase L1 biosynthesis ATPase subunit
MVSHNPELAERCDIIFPMEDGFLKDWRLEGFKVLRI